MRRGICNNNGGVSGISMMMICLCIAVERCLGTVHTVGDSPGWTLGVDYGTWSSSQTFLVGDTLVFKYGSGHTVDEVSESEYKTCTEGNPISRDNTGSTSIILQTAGTHYFVCGVVGHCGSGMKLSVTVSPSASAPKSSSTNSPPSTSTATPSTSTTSTTPPAGYGYGYGYGFGTLIPDSATSSLHLHLHLHGFLLTFAIACATHVAFPNPPLFF